ncbi:MAG: sigma 54-interacting transcriptional regulator [Myxococcota bacterium]|nr:sigma 54-interacting transcriptional regulator [Myxococcota bacterium]
MAITIGFEDGVDGAPTTLSGAVMTIGRVAGNDLVLADPRISSRHGRLLRQGEGYMYEDLGSRNGSMLDRHGDKKVLLPHDPVSIAQGDRLCLGDLVNPVTLVIRRVAQTLAAYDGGTVVASRSALITDTALSANHDNTMMRELFDLLHNLSGKTDPHEVFQGIAQGILKRFSTADGVSIFLRTETGEWAQEFEQAQAEFAGELPQPSKTLLTSAVDSLELVSYLPGNHSATDSMIGLAGAVIMPLVSGSQAIGILHVSSTHKAFGPDALAWLSIAGVHVAASIVAARRFRALVRSQAELREENTTLKSVASMSRPILGQSESLMKSLKQLKRVARTETTVLVTGETGTGKELAARYVHAHSRRHDQTFAPINCGALSDELLNSELFGHKKGAFTGADRDRMGIFEAADGGTVFLDEIGEVSPAVQVRLLRVLQEREVQPVGSNAPKKVNVRIVAATNRDLEEEVRKGTFREDLYYRLAVFAVRLPPLRERGQDIVLLCEKFRESACARHDCWVGSFSVDAMRALRTYSWPGNVRQLEHEIERAVIMAEENGSIELEDLSERLLGRQATDTHGDALPQGRLKDVMATLEQRVIQRCLDDHGGNRTRTAEFLGISRQALQVKLAKWREAADRDEDQL